jgi:hypothetical protein
MGTVDDFITIIKNKEGFRFDKQVAEHIGVDNHSLANAKLRNKLPNNYIMWYCDNYNIDIKDFHKEIKLTKTDVVINDTNQNDKYLIALQKDKIQSVEKELLNKTEQLDYIKKSPIQSELWSQITPHFQTKVEIKPKLNVFAIGMLLKQVEVTGSKEWAKALGMSQQQVLDYHDIGVWHEWGKSPIEQIMVKSSKDAISNEIPTLEKIIEFVKNLTGDHYYNQTIVYKYKKKVVATHCASKIKWWNNPKMVITKNTILEVVNKN